MMIGMNDKVAPTLYMMLGYPGAGKTTTAEFIAKETGAIHLNSDRFRLHLYRQPKFTEEEHTIIYRALDYLTELLLTNGTSVIYDANLNRLVYRQAKYAIADRTNATAKLVWVKSDVEIARKHATVLADNNPHRPFGNMSSEMFERLVGDIQTPSSDEPIIEVPGENITPRGISKILEKINSGKN